MLCLERQRFAHQMERDHREQLEAEQRRHVLQQDKDQERDLATPRGIPRLPQYLLDSLRKEGMLGHMT